MWELKVRIREWRKARTNCKYPYSSHTRCCRVYCFRLVVCKHARTQPHATIECNKRYSNSDVTLTIR